MRTRCRRASEHHAPLGRPTCGPNIQYRTQHAALPKLHAPRPADRKQVHPRALHAPRCYGPTDSAGKTGAETLGATGQRLASGPLDPSDSLLGIS